MTSSSKVSVARRITCPRPIPGVGQVTTGGVLTRHMQFALEGSSSWRRILVPGKGEVGDEGFGAEQRYGEVFLRVEQASCLSTLVFLALNYFGLAEYARALPLLEKLNARLPRNSPDGHYLLASCYVMTQRWDDAGRTFANAENTMLNDSMPQHDGPVC
jgi:hypothetical protein